MKGGKWNGVEQSTTPFEMDLIEKEKETEICHKRSIGSLLSTPKPYPMSQKLPTAVTYEARIRTPDTDTPTPLTI